MAAIEGKTSKALKFLAQATTDAVEHGLLLQLYFVLNISVWIIPKNDAMHAFYQTWLDSLQRNLLNQPPVDLRQIENGLLPPAPNHGRP